MAHPRIGWGLERKESEGSWQIVETTGDFDWGVDREILEWVA